MGDLICSPQQLEWTLRNSIVHPPDLSTCTFFFSISDSVQDPIRAYSVILRLNPA